MKKIYTLFAILLSVFVLSACEKKEAEVLKVGINVDYPPFEYYENGVPTGIDIDLINEIGAKIGKEVVLEEMEFNTLLGALSTGKVDLIISAMDITEERKKSVDFTIPYFQNKSVLVVTENDNSITSIEDLQGKNVGVQLGTSADNFISNLEGVENVKFNDEGVAALNLKSGKVDVLATDFPVAEKIVLANDGLKIVEEVEIEKTEMGIAVNKNNPELLEELNEALSELQENGKLQEILSKYLD